MFAEKMQKDELLQCIWRIEEIAVTCMAIRERTKDMKIIQQKV